MLQVPIIENDSTRQRDVHAELRGDFYDVITVFEDVRRQRPFLRSHDVGSPQRVVEGRQLDGVVGQLDPNQLHAPRPLHVFKGRKVEVGQVQLGIGP